ncbi:MAG: NupC/NupG family nucleoside CNT transporter, partial [Gemmataceae bacterium]
MSWRAAILVVVLGVGAGVWFLAQERMIEPKVQACIGFFCFLGLAAAVSTDLRHVRLRTLLAGIALQFALALLILKFQVGDHRPVYEAFQIVGKAVSKFTSYSDKGAEFVFGVLANRDNKLTDTFGRDRNGFDYSFVFAVRALSAVIFISAFFTLLYHVRILPLVVRGMAWVMRILMRTSGAESLSVAANVFIGQTEAPLIIKPYLPRMTQSELLAVMIGGMAHISGSVMAVYIFMGADPVAILSTSVMAAPCSLYMCKLLMPETQEPETLGTTRTAFESPYRNVVDAFSGGASDGVQLAINIAAMLIAFIAFIALLDALLGLISPSLTLAAIFSKLFAPIALLAGVEPGDAPKV